MEKKVSLTYIRQVDGLRCVAILMVLMFHWFVNIIPSPFIKSIPWGIGVTLFFVISGYLITTILMNAKSDIDAGKSAPRRELLKFFYRRSLRIFPLYFIVSGIFVFYFYEEISKQVPYIFTYTLNLYQTFGGEIYGAVMHYWSLCVEEQFYLLWPFLILLLPAKSHKFLIPGIILLSIISRIYFNFSQYLYTSGGFPVNSFDALGMGALIAYIKIKNLFSYSVLKSRIVFAILLLGFFMFYRGGYSPYAFINHTFPMYVVLVFGTMVYIAVNGVFFSWENGYWKIRL